MNFIDLSWNKPVINNILPDEEFLKNISYKSSNFNKSLKQIRVKDIEIRDVLNDLGEFQKKISDCKDIDKHAPYRVKTRQSLLLKYEKYLKVNGNFLTCFNDLLGFRIKVKEYPKLKSIPEYFKIVDLLDGKKEDDGYRAIHLYYKKDNYHYPIEIQIWSEADWNFNEWAHIHLYKYYPSEVGLYMKNEMDIGSITTESEFIKCLEVLSDE